MNLTPGQERLAQELIFNAVTLRSDIIRRALDPRRDYNGECGFPESSQLTCHKYYDVFERNAIANRAVRLWAKETWQVMPDIYESEDGDTPTAFEDAWDTVCTMIQGEQNYLKQIRGNPVLEALKNADEMSGLGHYSIIVLGFDDSFDLRAPVAGFEEEHTRPLGYGDTVSPLAGFYKFTVNAAATKGRGLRYVQVFPEHLASIARYETNPTSPRFGLPTAYNVTFNDPRNYSAGIGMPISTQEIHWSRVVHVPPHAAQSGGIFGEPFLRPIINNVLSLGKLYGASPEAYWKNCFAGLSVETQPQLGGDVPMDIEGLKDMIEDYQHGLQPYLALAGFTAKTLPPNVVDPTPHIKAQLEAICIQLSVPMRIFLGSERGELASSQDDAAWNDRVKARQQDYVTPRIIGPFVNRLIAAGVLPQPTQFCVEWPDITSQSASERADISSKRVAAMVQYVTGGLSSLMGPHDFLVRELGYTEEEADAILANAVEAPPPEEEEMDAPEYAAA